MKRTISFKECDGCHQNTYDDNIEIVKSRAKYGDYDTSGETLDLCNECRDADHIICRLCNRVHHEANPCEGMRLVMAEVERAQREQFETPLGDTYGGE